MQETENRKLEAGSWGWETERRRLETGGRRLEAGNWRLGTVAESRRQESRGWRFLLQYSYEKCLRSASKLRRLCRIARHIPFSWFAVSSPRFC